MELDYSPRKKISHIIESKVQMNEFQSAFVSGLIRIFKPNKVVEIGVAEGGTSSLILCALENYSKNYKMYSNDLMNKINKVNKIGYLISETIAYLQIDPTNHILLTGDYAVNYTELIGNKIDLLILDTSHLMPGEILDFLVYYKMLSVNAIIILHDIANNHYSLIKSAHNYYGFNKSNYYATKILFDVVKGVKYLNFEEQSEVRYPNIAAFQINSTTDESILDLFSALTLNWDYPLSKDVYELYKNKFEKIYDKEKVFIFDKSFNLNRLSNEGSVKQLFVNKKSVIYMIHITRKYLKKCLKFFFRSLGI